MVKGVILIVVLVLVLTGVATYLVLRQKEDVPKCLELQKFLTSTGRCQSVGGDQNDYTTYRDEGAGEMINGCKAEEGPGGKLGLCKGTSMSSCKDITSDKKAQEDLKAYLGEPASGVLAKDTPYFQDVSNIMAQATKEIGKLTESGCISNFLANGVQPAVMFDQDDTIWSTWYEDVTAKYHYDADVFRKVAEATQMPTIDPVVDFLRGLRSKGIIAIFITGRPAKDPQVEMTLKQLAHIPLFPSRDYWVPCADVGDGGEVQSRSGIFMHSGSDTRTGKGSTASVYKQKSRCWIESNSGPGSVIGGERKIKFIMSVGDQWSDSNGKCAGIRVKLPNPMYYLP